MHAAAADRLQGMVGWWTFEEQAGGAANRRLRTGPDPGRLARDEPKRVAWATPFGDASAPTPASREAGVCPSSCASRRLAEKARRAPALIPCERCGAEVLTHGMRAHVGTTALPEALRLQRKLADSRTAAAPLPGRGRGGGLPWSRSATRWPRHAGGDAVTECRLGCGARLPARRARHRRSGAGCGRDPPERGCGRRGL